VKGKLHLFVTSARSGDERQFHAPVALLPGGNNPCLQWIGSYISPRVSQDQMVNIKVLPIAGIETRTHLRMESSLSFSVTEGENIMQRDISERRESHQILHNKPICNLCTNIFWVIRSSMNLWIRRVHAWGISFGERQRKRPLWIRRFWGKDVIETDLREIGCEVLVETSQGKMENSYGDGEALSFSRKLLHHEASYFRHFISNFFARIT
jgi:hypothetical protein